MEEKERRKIGEIRERGKGKEQDGEFREGSGQMEGWMEWGRKGVKSDGRGHEGGGLKGAGM